MNAEIISIGSELLLGQIVDTNATWLAQRLADLGVNLYYKTVVGDNPTRMRDAFHKAMSRSDVIITTGGIGPTEDDLTREIVAEVTERSLDLDQSSLDLIQAMFDSRDILMTPNNKKQAYMPSGAIVLENPNGTAPSFIVEDSRGVVISLPGVPSEMKWLFEQKVTPYLRRKFNLSEMIIHLVLKISQMGESTVDHKIGHLIASSKNPTVGILAHPGQVDVRISAKASDNESARKLIRPVEAEIRTLLGDNIFATNGESMEDALCKVLTKNKMTIAVYEDVTGGMTAERFRMASADTFAGGFVAGNLDSTRTVILCGSSMPIDFEELITDGPRLTEALARSVRSFVGGADIGVAVHSQIPVSSKKNRSGGSLATNAYISLAADNIHANAHYKSFGANRLDRERISLNALDLARRTILANRPGCK